MMGAYLTSGGGNGVKKNSQPTRHRAYRLRIFLFFTRASLVN